MRTANSGIKTIKEIVGRIPIIGTLAQKIKRRFLARLFPESKAYWIERYERGGDSGQGSSGKLAEFKAEIINDFVRRHNVATVIEYGCGEGSQLKLAQYPNYLGFDVSPEAISRCKEMFAGDPTKRFGLMKNYRGERAELTLSLDVIYHLIEDKVFESYMKTLFNSSDRFVVVYSSDYDEPKKKDFAHVRHRKFTKWVEGDLPEWKLVKHIPNKYPYAGDASEGSSSDFFLYEKA